MLRDRTRYIWSDVPKKEYFSEREREVGDLILLRRRDRRGPSALKSVVTMVVNISMFKMVVVVGSTESRGSLSLVELPFKRVRAKLG